MVTIKEKIEAAHKALSLPSSGAIGRPQGALSWFREQVHGRTGWRPGTATVHRWISGEVDVPRSELTETLIELEKDAEVAREFDARARALKR